MVAGFMEEGVCVCGLKINLSEHFFMCGVDWVEENCLKSVPGVGLLCI